MADKRFFENKGPLTLAQIATIAESVLPEGVQGDRVMTDVAGLTEATKNDVSWAFISAVRDDLKNTKAGAVIVPKEFLAYVPETCVPLVSADPHRSYGLVAGAFYPYPLAPGISEKAFIDSTATIGENCQIEAGAVIGPYVEIGDHCHIQAGAVLRSGVKLGHHCIIGSNAVVSHCLAGNKVYIYPGAMIGQDGFGFAMSKKGPTKVPQLGRVIIGDDVEISANTTVDRGAMGDTMIGSGTRIDNLVQVAHNVKLGTCCVLVSQVGIAGSCEFGDFVVAGGQSGFAGHLKIASGTKVAAQSGVMRDTNAMAVLMGSPAIARGDWMRQYMIFQKIAEQFDVLKKMLGLSQKKASTPHTTSLTDKVKLWFLRRKNDD